MANVHCVLHKTVKIELRNVSARKVPCCHSHALANRSAGRKVAARVSKAQLNALKTDVQQKQQQHLNSETVTADDVAGQEKSLQPIAQEPVLQHLLQSGPACIALGAFVCSFISLQIKLFDHPLPPLEVSAVCSGAAWAATSVILKVKDLGSNSNITDGILDSSSSSSLRIGQPTLLPGGSNTSSSTFLLLLLRGTLAAVAVTCYYSAIEELPLPVAVALFFFHPIFAVVFDVAVTGRRIPPVAAGSCVLTVVGVLIIGWHDQLLEHVQELTGFVAAALGVQSSSSSSSSTLVTAELPLGGVLGGLAAAAANAAAFVTVNVIGPEVSPWRLTYWQHLVVTHAAVGLLALETLEEDYVELQQEAPAIHSAAEWLQAAAAKMFVLVSHGLPDRHDAMLLGGILVANFVGQVLLSLGFQRMDAGRGSAVNTTQVLFGCVWDVTLLHTAPSMAMAVGAMAIAAGVYGSAVLSSSEGDGGDGGSSSLDGGRDLAGEAK